MELQEPPQEVPRPAPQVTFVETSYIQKQNVILPQIQIPPDLARVLVCESGLKHYDSKGNVLRSFTNDIGIMQINLKAHLEEAQKLGYNLWNKEDNIAYGLRLYRQFGLKPWVCSRKI